MAHDVGLASIAEQPNGRVMDARSKPNQRLVPGRLDEAERLTYDVISHHHETRIVALSAAEELALPGASLVAGSPAAGDDGGPVEGHDHGRLDPPSTGGDSINLRD